MVAKSANPIVIIKPAGNYNPETMLHSPIVQADFTNDTDGMDDYDTTKISTLDLGSNYVAADNLKRVPSKFPHGHFRKHRLVASGVYLSKTSKHDQEGDTVIAHYNKYGELDPGTSIDDVLDQEDDNTRKIHLAYHQFKNDPVVVAAAYRPVSHEQTDSFYPNDYIHGKNDNYETDYTDVNEQNTYQTLKGLGADNNVQ